MKLICILFACLLFFTPAYAIDHSKLDAFKAEVENAIQANDFVALNKCFYWADTPQVLIDQTLFGYQCNMKQYKFKDITFQALDDKTINPAFIDTYVKGADMNGRYYKPNLDVLMLCTVNFKSKSGEMTIGAVGPIGVSPDGSIKFTGTSVNPVKN